MCARPGGELHVLAALQPVALWTGHAAVQLQRWAAGRLAAADAGAASAAGERAGMQREAHEWLEARRPTTAAGVQPASPNAGPIHSACAFCKLRRDGCSVLMCEVMSLPPPCQLLSY